MYLILMWKLGVYKGKTKSPNLYANCMQKKSKSPALFSQGSDFQVEIRGIEPLTF